MHKVSGYVRALHLILCSLKVRNTSSACIHHRRHAEMSWGDNRQRRREMIFLEAALCRHTAFSHPSIPIPRFCILMLTTFDPFGFASAFGLRLNCFLGEGNKQTCNQAIIYITRVLASGVVENVTNDIYALPFHAPNDPCIDAGISYECRRNASQSIGHLSEIGKIIWCWGHCSKILVSITSVEVPCIGILNWFLLSLSLSYLDLNK